MKKAAFPTLYKKRLSPWFIVHGSLLFNHELLTVKALRDEVQSHVSGIVR